MMESETRSESIYSGGKTSYSETIGTERIYAGFWIRCGATLLDWLCLQAVFVMFHLTFGYSLLEPPLGLTLIQSLVSLVYYVVMTVIFGQTLGKMATGIKVIRNDGSPNTWGIIILRELIGKFVSSLILFVGYMMAGWDGKKRALHDRMFATRVVKVNK
ncbi:RDD family protein [Paenibacillus radicis (ex Xue et al. 2023)]|uniref:RDD family protein n=1 Tax=Paenibacillus radicis (ex Xue et al. 2023) TaxID=2972489 RepID=A0ABT1Y9L0_9BACL|nr:RDD family protein [Paenibacillus radicis (ex Xue et al. 2023)]MCR8629874.1 RDD family protein [Paenibacillus radicis (ex Xue et al. 2023)]